MSLYNFGKHIFLPSGGLSYPPHCWLYPTTKEFMFLEVDPTSKDSRLEFVLTLIHRYCKLPVDIFDLYFDDMLFIWMNMLSIDISKSTEIAEVDKCTECGTINKILVDFADLNYNITNPNNNNLKESTEIVVNDIKITTHYRKIRDSLTFGTMSLYNDPNYVDSCILYMAPQIDTMSFEGETIEKNEYVEFLQNQHMYEIFSLYYHIMKLDGTFGVNKNIKYHCKKCNAINKTQIFKDINFSNISKADDTPVYNIQKSLVKYIMNYSSMHSMPTKEFIDFPLRLDDQLNDVLNISKIKNGSIFTTYSDGLNA